MITLGKRGDLAARRLAAAYLMTDEAVDKLFDTVGPRFGDRKGGYTCASSAPAGRKATAPTRLSSNCSAARRCSTKRNEKRAEVRAKRAAETKKAMEEAEAQGGAAAEPAEGGDKGDKKE